MRRENDFTQGAILGPLLNFVAPVFFALLLLSMYGAVDLLIVGRFSDAASVSAVSTGSQVMMCVTTLISSFAMGTTIHLGHVIGQGDERKIPAVIGANIALFGAAGLLLSVLSPLLAGATTELMQTPEEAIESTALYLAICGAGTLPLVAYTLFGSVFRGMGDSKTPLVTVAIACVLNILGDLYLVASLGMGAKGAAIATVAAQAASVFLSCALVRKHPLVRGLCRRHVRFDHGIIRRVVSLGAPIALQDILVSVSFLVILGIINRLGLVASAGGGVAERICFFIMLVPVSFMDSISAFVAQNIGARKPDRARKALLYGISVSTAFGVVMFFFSFFHGDVLAAIFTAEPPVAEAAVDYLRAYAVDCLMTCFLFCFIGYFNGLGMTRFVMIQGLVGAFLVRIPVSLYMSRQEWATLFHIGLAVPCATVVQIALCLTVFYFANRDGARQSG